MYNTFVLSEHLAWCAYLFERLAWRERFAASVLGLLACS
jgi:hypothetical protein